MQTRKTPIHKGCAPITSLFKNRSLRALAAYIQRTARDTLPDEEALDPEIKNLLLTGKKTFTWEEFILSAHGHNEKSLRDKEIT